jgi:hypothetical protein
MIEQPSQCPHVMLKHTPKKWLKVFVRQWLWEFICIPLHPEWREHFRGTCFRCMHYKSQHIKYENGTVKCAAEGGCNCFIQELPEIEP